MAKGKRQALKRRMAQAHYGVDRSLAKIQDLHTMFSEQHEEHAEYLMLIAATLVQAQEMMLNFWLHSWGKLPENLDTYRT